ncbi:hypothetical protein H4R34_003108 [Dimargaris verticillata]|uniref:Uncharacterized protein n=1 Tax=Dimargaris verticillata TaxID=2761393 RepID=A0A9W8B6V4_9FUNG|nr:hypothetical protein H4R34_003108 [Dimargaris verticillata]
MNRFTAAAVSLSRALPRVTKFPGQQTRVALCTPTMHRLVPGLPTAFTRSYMNIRAYTETDGLSEDDQAQFQHRVDEVLTSFLQDSPQALAHPGAPADTSFISAPLKDQAARVSSTHQVEYTYGLDH